MDIHQYEFRKGFEIIEKGSREMIYIRRRGLELAKENNANITCFLYNEFLNKWQSVGYYTPAERFVNSWGNICILDADGRNFRIEK